MFCAFTSIGIFPICLHGIGMERDLVLPGDCPEFRDRLDGADLVVGVHDGDEDGLVGDRLLQFGRVNETVLVYREVR